MKLVSIPGECRKEYLEKSDPILVLVSTPGECRKEYLEESDPILVSIPVSVTRNVQIRRVC